MTIELQTTRLRLRAWRPEDLAPWAALNADPEVREFFDGPLTPERAEASMNLFQQDLTARGWGWWALADRESGALLGMAGLDPVDEGLPFTGIEMGWRLARSAWGRGYATEAARAVLDFAFATLELPEVLAIAAIGNTRSRAVMTRLGMTQTRTFDDPAQPPHLATSVLYTATR